MIELFLFMCLMGIFFFINLVSASNIGLIPNSQWQQNLSKVRYSSTSFGDIDNDGDLDLALTGCLTATANRCTAGTIAKIYINNGTTLTENQTWQDNLTGVGWSSTSFGDIDNDGDLDLALSGCTNTSDGGTDCYGSIISKVYINNGSTLIESRQWQNNLTGVFDGQISLGDIDNDGKVDLVTIGRTVSSKIAKIYINNGSSLVESNQWQGNLTGLDDTSLASGDIDNDGDLDLALTGEDSSSTKTTKIYINNGTSLIESSQWQSGLTQLSESSSIFGDIDNDGDLDYIIMGCCDELVVYDNNGSLFIYKQGDVTYGDPDLIGIFAGSLAFGDYDNDGYLDFATMGRENDRNRVYWNNLSKENNFSRDNIASQNLKADDLFWGTLTWADLDRDGDLDLVATGINTSTGLLSRVYISNASLIKNNTQPNSPINFSSNYSSSIAILNLSWGNGSDVETNTSGLYYNLMIGNSTNNHTIVSGVYGGSSGGGDGGGPSAGYFGNMMQRKSISLNVNLSNGTYYWAVQTIDTGLAKSNWSERQSFTVGTDTTSPVLSSISSSVTSSSATITWTTDENSNSTVYYGITKATTSSSGSSSLVTSHSVSLSGLSASTFYYYNVSSCDNSSNCNTSSQYNFTTSAPADGGTTTGGGGGGGTILSKNITTQPKKFDIDFSKTNSGSFEAKQGDIKTFSFNSEISHKITLSEVAINSVKLIIESEPIVLLLGIGETKQIDINKDSINDFEIKLVSIINGMASFSLKKLSGADIVAVEELEEAVRKEALFDVKIYILDKFKEVFPGEEVSAEIEVFNINNIGQVDVVVNYYLSDNGSVFGEGASDTLAVEAVTSFVRSLIVPEDLKPGIYYFDVDVSYKNFTTSGKAEFEVKSTKLRFIEKRWKEIIIVAIGIAALIAITVFFYLRMIKKREEKIEREEQKIRKKESKLEKKEERLEKRETKLEKEVKVLERKPMRFWRKKK